MHPRCPATLGRGSTPESYCIDEGPTWKNMEGWRTLKRTGKAAHVDGAHFTEI